jgi:glutathione S-transferase
MPPPLPVALKKSNLSIELARRADICAWAHGVRFASKSGQLAMCKWRVHGLTTANLNQSELGGLKMSLALYGHPFSSYTQKVLIALYENGTPFEFRCLGPDTPQHSAEWLRRWPLRKFPLLVDGERSIAETSIIIEYLQLAHPGPVRMLPADPMAALDVRFLDRFFDLHVMSPVQHAVDGALTGDPVKRQEGLALAAKKLELAYAWLEGQLAGRAWAAGADFTLADCAAAPALFYADWTRRISGAFPLLRTYRARLLARPSFARAVEEARPFRSIFPLGAPERD